MLRGCAVIVIVNAKAKHFLERLNGFLKDHPLPIPIPRGKNILPVACHRLPRQPLARTTLLVTKHRGFKRTLSIIRCGRKRQQALPQGAEQQFDLLLPDSDSAIAIAMRAVSS